MYAWCVIIWDVEQNIKSPHNKWEIHIFRHSDEHSEVLLWAEKVWLVVDVPPLSCSSADARLFFSLWRHFFVLKSCVGKYQGLVDTVYELRQSPRSVKVQSSLCFHSLDSFYFTHAWKCFSWLSCSFNSTLIAMVWQELLKDHTSSSGS